MLSHRQPSLQIIFTSINNVMFFYQRSARSRSCRRHEYNFVYFVSFVGKLKFLKFKLTFRVFEKGKSFEFYSQALCYLLLQAFSFKVNFEGLTLHFFPFFFIFFSSSLPSNPIIASAASPPKTQAIALSLSLFLTKIDCFVLSILAFALSSAFFGSCL